MREALQGTKQTSDEMGTGKNRRVGAATGGGEGLCDVLGCWQGQIDKKWENTKKRRGVGI